MRETPEPMRESPHTAVGEAPLEGGPWRTWARAVAIAAAGGAFLALVGAAGTADAPLGRRLLYWLPMMVLGVALGNGVAALVTRALPARANVWLLGSLITLGVSVLGGGFVIAFTHFYWGLNYARTDWPAFLLVLVVISAAMTAIMITVNRPGVATHARGALPATAPRFLDRMPQKLRGAVLYAISAEDHYLRLHTSKGADIILMRLADAIGELEGVEGAQTHRSWWVARDAVESARRDGDRVTLQLKGGVEAPVSRPNVRPLREAGWF